MSPLPEPSPGAAPRPAVDLDALVAVLPGSQREVVSMLKVTGMSLEEAARSDSVERRLRQAEGASCL